MITVHQDVYFHIFFTDVYPIQAPRDTQGRGLLKAFVVRAVRVKHTVYVDM